MKTSARNQFPGKVVQMKRGAVNDEIDVELASGQHIVAIITRDSTDRLGLQHGMPAFAMVKASSIILVVDDGKARFSARNRMDGTVARMGSDAVNTEVVIDIEGGGAIAAVITHESCTTLGLAVGSPVSAIFKASSVIVGVMP